MKFYLNNRNNFQIFYEKEIQMIKKFDFKQLEYIGWRNY